MGTASNQINLSQDFSSPHSQHNPIFFHTKTSPPSSLGSSGPTAAADCTCIPAAASFVCLLPPQPPSHLTSRLEGFLLKSQNISARVSSVINP